MEKPTNFRDLGGLRGHNGRRVKTRRLLRSGEPVGLSEHEIKQLTELYALKTILDLREQNELDVSPVDTMPGVQYVHMDVFSKVDSAQASLDFFKSVKTPEQMQEAMEYLYRLFARETQIHSMFKEVLCFLASHKEGAALFHCFAGKDRTGFTAMLILALLGVSEADILADYMLTNAMREKDTISRLKNEEEQGASKEKIECLRIAMSVQRKFFEILQAEAEQNYGSLYDMACHITGFTPAEIEELRNNYLE